MASLIGKNACQNKSLLGQGIGVLGLETSPEREEGEKKRSHVGIESTPYIYKGKRDNLALGAMTHPRQLFYSFSIRIT
eukprot:1149155-Pelagomonas_calceolata.AAC.2